MTAPPVAAPYAPADGMAFHVLGEQGILFSEERQEIHLLDAAASYVWCSVIEGTGLDDIATAYAEACDMSASDAHRLIGDLLHRWLGLGYIRGAPVASASPIDLMTAVGRLLVNAALRASFAADPRTTAESLRLRAEDVPLFTGIDPDQLERMAEAGDEGTDGTTDETVVESAILRYRTRPWTTPSAARCYRLGGLVFRIGYDTPDQEARIHGTLSHLEISPTQPDLSVDVIAETEGHVVLLNGKPAAWCDRLDRLARTALVLVRDRVIDREGYFLLIHAGLVSTGEACVMLPAAPGSGKSTLAAGLARAGFTFFTDEIAMLDAGTMAARPFSFPVVVKEGSMAPLLDPYPELATLPVALRDNDQPVRYLPLRVSSLPLDSTGRQPVRWIVFPRYDGDGPTELKPLPPEAALARLLGECRIVKSRLDRDNVAGLITWLGNTACYDLPMSSLPTAVSLLQELCGVSPPSHDGRD